MIGEHPDGTSCFHFHSFTIVLVSLPTMTGVGGRGVGGVKRRRWRQQRNLSCDVCQRSRISNMDSRKCASLVRRSVASSCCTDTVCGERFFVCLFFCCCVIARRFPVVFECDRGQRASETCVSVCLGRVGGGFLPATAQPDRFSMHFKRKEGGVVDNVMPTHHPLAAHERAHNLGSWTF